ncbi:MAG: IS982 family transposase [Gammaproteobacteria bacterium]|nr:IS982 family transposase [Gammaproteobacteria bacterium]
MYIDTETLITVVYLMVDDWYIAKGHKYLEGKLGRKPEFTDSEMITFMVLKEFLQFSSERKFIGFMRGNYSHMFPDMVDQSQFNRRSRALRLIMDKLPCHFADELDTHLASLYVVDTEPVPVVGYKRSKKNSDFFGSAEYGYCASKKMSYWGYKCVMLVTANGIPVAFELVPANTDERDAAEEVLHAANPGSIALGDKGFIDQQRQQDWKKRYGVTVYTYKRKNQHEQNSPIVQHLLSKNRRQIETTFSSLDRVEGLEDHGAKTVLGLVTRTIAKIAAYTLRKYLLRFHGIDVLTFQTVKIL